jgi:hypothetical protein
VGVSCTCDANPAAAVLFRTGASVEKATIMQASIRKMADALIIAGRISLFIGRQKYIM